LNLTKAQQKASFMFDADINTEELDPTSDQIIELDGYANGEIKYNTLKSLFDRSVIEEFHTRTDVAGRAVWSVMFRPNHIRSLANQIRSI
jgi:hypothetical protein